jgi:hypothetical protein
MIQDHRYDAGWPRDDSKGCISVWTRDSGPTYMRDAGDVCAAPESSHQHSEYPSQRPGRTQGNGTGRDAGSMHEPKPYTGDLDWQDSPEWQRPAY